MDLTQALSKWSFFEAFGSLRAIYPQYELFLFIGLIQARDNSMYLRANNPNYEVT